MIEITLADYSNPAHAQAVIAMLDAYAKDPMGGSEGISDEVKENLIKEMDKREYVFSLLAFDGDQPVGVANCVEGFSTFAAKPLMNIHDIAVIPEYRGEGVAQKLLEEVKTLAQFRGCVKLTLEVLDKNDRAKKAYEKFGFKPYELGDVGQAEFWEMYL